MGTGSLPKYAQRLMQKDSRYVGQYSFSNLITFSMLTSEPMTIIFVFIPTPLGGVREI